MEDKIEVEEYVRFNNGEIGKAIDIKENPSRIVYSEYGEIGLISDIAKHSKQLIDLIEVKDLVCFKNKLQNSLKNEEMIIHIFDNDTLEEVKQAIKKGEIELLEILTKEQYMANCYKVGGEDE